MTRFYKRYVITRSPAMGRPRFSYRVYKPAGIDGPWICIGSATSRRGAHEIVNAHRWTQEHTRGT